MVEYWSRLRCSVASRCPHSLPRPARERRGREQRRLEVPAGRERERGREGGREGGIEREERGREREREREEREREEGREG